MTDESDEYDPSSDTEDENSEIKLKEKPKKFRKQKELVNNQQIITENGNYSDNYINSLLKKLTDTSKMKETPLSEEDEIIAEKINKKKYKSTIELSDDGFISLVDTSDSDLESEVESDIDTSPHTKLTDKDANKETSDSEESPVESDTDTRTYTKLLDKKTSDSEESEVETDNETSHFNSDHEHETLIEEPEILSDYDSDFISPVSSDTEISGGNSLLDIKLSNKPNNNYEFVKIDKDKLTTINTYAGLVGLPDLSNHNI